MDFHDRRDGQVKPRHVLEREERARKLASQPFKLVTKGRGMVHIDGIGSQGNYGANAGLDIGRGQVEYQADSHCGGLSRIGAFRHVPSGHDTIHEALKVQQSGVFGKPCATCAKAAQQLAGQ